MQQPVLLRHHLYYGWYVAGASFVAFFICFGIVYSFTSFSNPIDAALRASEADEAALFSVTYTIYSLAGIVTGWLADRFGPRPLVAIGAVLIGSGLILASRATAFWQFFLAYSIGVGFGSGCIYIPGTAVVEHWFVQRRGFASGIPVAGLGAGNLIMAPLGAALVYSLGWRTAFVIMGAGAFMLILAAAMLLAPSPASRGIAADEGAAGMTPVPPLVPDATLRQALHSRAFWFLFAAILAGSAGVVLPFSRLVDDAELYGASPLIAASLLGLIGAGTLTGRFLLGPYTDRFRPRPLLAAVFASLAVAMLWWLFAKSSLSLALFAFGFGIFYGTNSALLPTLAADYFGVAHSGAIIGLLFTAVVPGGLLVPTLGGIEFDRSHSHTLVVLLGMVAFVVASLCVLALPKMSRRPWTAAQPRRGPLPATKGTRPG